MKKTHIFVLACALLLTTTGCEPVDHDLTKALPYAKNVYQDFTKTKPSNKNWEISHQWSNSADLNGPFGVTWHNSQVSCNDKDGLVLSVSKTDNLNLIVDANGKQRDDFDPYLGGEIRTREKFTYGFFGAYLKPAKISGTVSTLFTYTGPTENNPHDEIDIEFLGKNTTKVQFNYYAGSELSHEYWHHLDFDASEDYHHYGFYWGEREITWYVDFEPVYRVGNIKTPTHPCKLMSNFWKTNSKSPSIVAWGGNSNEEDFPASAFVKSIDISDVDGNPVIDKPIGIEYDYLPTAEQLSPTTVTLGEYNPVYTVEHDETNNAYDISYEEVNPYTCTELMFSVDDEEFANKKWLALDIKNKGQNSSKITLQISEENSANKYLDLTCAWLDDSADAVKVRNDLKAATVNIPAGETKTLIVRYSGLNANDFHLLVDSDAPEDPSNFDPIAGNVVISNFRTGGVQDYGE